MNRLPEKEIYLGSHRNMIRELFEYGRGRIAEVGSEKVYDFALGNPSVAPPEIMNQTLKALLEEGPNIHQYTSAQGDGEVRADLAASLSRRFGGTYCADDLYLTVGATAALCCCAKALTCPGDEFVVLAPYFMEYNVFLEGAGAKVVVSQPDPETFLIDFDSLEACITSHTKGVVINSPNNPSGVVYPEEVVKRLGDLLRRKSAEYDHPIYLISDEPYREIVFQGFSVPWLPHYYENTLVCYSYSKSLSIPGERMGYVLIPPTVADHDLVYAAVCGAGRVMGYICAPSLFQRMVAKCDGQTADLSVYQTNRDLLYHGLTELGYTCLEPGGTFYLMMKALEPDAVAFCERAKAHDLLVVPSDGFGVPGWIRVAFCVPTERVQRALPVFAQLAREYGIYKGEA